jgi:hypothetical protein
MQNKANLPRFRAGSGGTVENKANRDRRGGDWGLQIWDWGFEDWNAGSVMWTSRQTKPILGAEAALQLMRDYGLLII